MRIAIGLVLLSGLLFADPITERVGPQIVTLPEQDCPAQLYTWDGVKLACAEIDRIALLTAQRNLNMVALRACEEKSNFLTTRLVLEQQLYKRARNRCREMGKRFDPETVSCAETLPPREPKK